MFYELASHTGALTGWFTFVTGKVHKLWMSTTIPVTCARQLGVLGNMMDIQNCFLELAWFLLPNRKGFAINASV